MALLSESEIRTALTDLPEWHYSSAALSRSLEFPTFMDAIRFVYQLAKAAEEADHHPDIDIRFRKVTLSLTSHDVGGVTTRDIKMAARIDQIAAGLRR